MQLACSTRVARWWNAEQGISSRRQPAIKDWPKSGKWPDRHDRRQPFPTWQYPNHFNPGEVSFAPMIIRRADVHLSRHFFPRVRGGAFPDFWIVVIQPFDAIIAIKRLDMRAHPATEVAIAVGVNFDFGFSIFHSFRSRTCPANDGTMVDKSAL